MCKECTFLRTLLNIKFAVHKFIPLYGYTFVTVEMISSDFMDMITEIAGTQPKNV